MNSRIKELINPLPGYTIMHVTAEANEMTNTLTQMLEKIEDTTLNLAIYEVTDKIEKLGENVKVQYVDGYDKIYRALPRDNDIVILQDVVSRHTNKEKLLKNTYMTLANAAYIIIMEKKGVMDLTEVTTWLFEREFRAVNDIDIIEGYDLIMAKKMHMWGNGL